MGDAQRKAGAAYELAEAHSSTEVVGPLKGNGMGLKSSSRVRIYPSINYGVPPGTCMSPGTHQLSNNTRVTNV